VGIPGAGGDIGYGGESVRVGEGGDSLRVGFDSIWITDYERGLLERIPIQQLLTR